MQRAGGQGGMESTGGEESWRRTEIPAVAFGTNFGHCRGQGLWSRLGGSARFLGSRRRRSSGSEMADAAAEKQRIGDGGEVLGEEEQGAHIYRMGAFCPEWSHHPGQKGLLSRVVAPLGTKGVFGRAGKIPSSRPTFSPGWM